METVDLRRQFDAVISVDSLACLTTGPDLKKAFLTAYRHLNPGGIFIVPVEYSKENFQPNKTETVTQAKRGVKITYIETNRDPVRNDNKFDVILDFLIWKDNKLIKRWDRIACGLFGLATWVKLLKEAGFKVKKLKFFHSTFAKGSSLPLLVGIK
jgi:hypothetical protein